jgi:replicative DNA helicase
MNIAALIREPTAAEVEIEQCVLGLLLDGAETAWFVLDRIDASDMLEPLHQRIVVSARRILDGGKDPNPLTLAAAMAADKGLDEVGGAGYLRHISQRFGGNHRIAADLCQALAGQALKRSLAHEIAETEARLRDNDISGHDILAEHEAAILALSEGKPQPDEPADWYEVAQNVLEKLEAPKVSGSGLLRFGIPGLDGVVGGMAPGDLIILAGRPGMGKTALALVIAYAAARPKAQIQFDLEPEQPPASVGVFMTSLEMKREALLQRGLSMRVYETGVKVPYSHIRMNKLQESEHSALINALIESADIPIVIDHRRGQTVSQIGVRARRAQAKMRRAGKKLGLLVIDHLGLIDDGGRYRNNKAAEITETTKGLKALAGNLDVPILCLCQLSRRVEDRDDKRPYLSDLRDSGSIEQDADVVLLLHRAEYYLQKSKPDANMPAKKRDEWEIAMDRAKGKLGIQVAKNRNGPEAEIMLRCEMAYNWIGGLVG